jgi:hypothetical protein
MSTHCKHPLLTSHIEAGSFPGWVFVTRLEMPPHSKCSLVCCSHAWHSTVKCTSATQPATGTPYPQVSQVPGKISLSFARQRSPPSVETTISRQHLKGAQQPRRISEWLFVDRSGHRQVIHILLHRRFPSQTDRARLMRWKSTWLHTHPAPSIPIQYIPSHRCINGSVQKEPAIQLKGLTRASLIQPLVHSRKSHRQEEVQSTDGRRYSFCFAPQVRLQHTGVQPQPQVPHAHPRSRT